MAATYLRWATAFMVGACGCIGCDTKTDGKSGAPQGVAIRAGDLMDERISYQLAIYYLPRPLGDPIETLDRLLAGKFKQFKRVEKIDENDQHAQVAVWLDKKIQENYKPPDLKSLKYFGRGLSREQADSLQKSECALILDFSYPKQLMQSGLLDAMQLMMALADQTGGILWDDETREAFTPEAWTERRIESWNDGLPDVTKHITIHAYNTGNYIRAISLGMKKFGLPDLVIDEFSWSLNNNMGILVHLLAQSLVEDSKLARNGQYDLNIRRIKHPKVRQPQTETFKENATGIALLSLTEGTWEEGDPRNRIIEIGFDRGSGPDIHAKQMQIVSDAFGSEDSITQIKHDDELEAASQRARAKLPGLKQQFDKGLPPGEFIQVKVPFGTADGGREWMWVEVTTWDGDKITGLLQNEPFSVPGLHAGQSVEVSAAEIFDYILRHRDGTIEGNETGEIIRRQQGQAGK